MVKDSVYNEWEAVMGSVTVGRRKEEGRAVDVAKRKKNAETKKRPIIEGKKINE